MYNIYGKLDNQKMYLDHSLELTPVNYLGRPPIFFDCLNISCVPHVLSVVDLWSCCHLRKWRR